MAIRKGHGHDGKGFDARNGSGHGPVGQSDGGLVGNALLTSTTSELEEGTAALSYLLMRTDGWLRAVPDGDGKVLYCKWKYTRGAHAGSYVMAMVAMGAWPAGFTILLRKVTEVDQGTRRPTADTPYS